MEGGSTEIWGIKGLRDRRNPWEREQRAGWCSDEDKDRGHSYL